MFGDRPITPTQALGASSFEKLANLDLLIDPLRLLTQDVEHVEIDSQPIPPAQAFALMEAAGENPQESWSCCGLASGKWLCIDRVTKNISKVDVAAVVLPQLHTQLISWWLMHAWRFVELGTACSHSLKSWNINVASILARSIIEEVGCLFDEAKEIAEKWSDFKQRHADATEIRNSLAQQLASYKSAHRGLDVLKTSEAKNVMTYVDKLEKGSGLDGLRSHYYTWLSNGAHPAVGSRVAYLGPILTNPNEVVRFLRNSRGPRGVGDPTDGSGMGYAIAQLAADALIDVGEVGCALLWQSLRLVDDFGLTTKAYRFTDYLYWRKLRHLSSERNCPCGCGKWTSNQHSWRKPAPAISAVPGNRGIVE